MFSTFWALLLPLLVGSIPFPQDLFPTDCADVYANGHTLSEVYTIYPAGDTPVQVYCDMGCWESRIEDGNWTVCFQGINSFSLFSENRLSNALNEAQDKGRVF